MLNLKTFIYSIFLFLLLSEFSKASGVDLNQNLNFVLNNTLLAKNKLNFTKWETSENNFQNPIKCEATKTIKERQTLFNIPKEYLICSFDYFPYKLELKEAIADFFNKKNSYANDTLKITNKILFSFNIMYLLYENKTDLYELMTKSKQTSYIVKPTNEALEYINSIPNDILNKDMFDENDKKLYDLAITHFMNEGPITEILDFVIEFISKKYRSQAINILPWINNNDLFKFANSIISSRGFALNLNNYEIVHNKSLLYMQMGYKQTEKLKDINSVDGICLIPLVDVCFKKYSNKEFVEYEIISTPNNLKVALNKNFNEGEEVYYMDNVSSANEQLLTKYGFYVKNNPNSMSFFWVTINKQKFSQEKNLICSALNCFDSSLEMFYRSDKIDNLNLVIPIFKNEINKRVLNALRLLILKDENVKNNENKLFDKLSRGQIINFNNELEALEMYRDQIIKTSIAPSKFTLEDILYSLHNTKSYFKSNEEKIKNDINLSNAYKIRKGIMEVAREEKLILLQNVYFAQKEIKKIMSDQFNKIRDYYRQ